MGVSSLRALSARSRSAVRLARRLRSARDSRFSTRLRFDPQAPKLILSPHLDDAVLNCWSLLTDHEPVSVVNVFAGLPASGPPASWDRLCRAGEARSRMIERRDEDRAALALAGREPVHLELVEVLYRNGWRAPSLGDMDAALVERVPSASAVLVPLAVIHADHKLVRRHGLAIARAGIPVALYGEVPQSAQHGWPHWATGEPERPYLDPAVLWEDALEQAGLDRAARPRVVRLTDEEADAKLRALRAYETQFDALDGGPLGILRNRAVIGFELFWRVDRESA